MVTAARGTTAPELSLTVPEMRPVAFCAKTATAKSSAAQAALRIDLMLASQEILEGVYHGWGAREFNNSGSRGTGRAYHSRNSSPSILETRRRRSGTSPVAAYQRICQSRSKYACTMRFRTAAI